MLENLGIINFWTFLVAAIFVIVIPGPNSIFVLTTAGKNGVKDGYLAAGGVFIGDGVLIVLSSLGIASIIKTVAIVFTIIKYLGAAYIFYLGVMMIKSVWQSYYIRKNQVEVLEEIDKPKVKHPFRKALILSLSNPKAIIFYLAFFVQFVDPNYAHTTISFLLLGMVIELMDFLYLSLLIFMGVSLSLWFSKHKVITAVMSCIVGLVFIGFSVELATASLN